MNNGGSTYHNAEYKFLCLCCAEIPVNKSLYTISYMLITSASAGITFCATYLLVSFKSQFLLFGGL